MSGQSGVDGLEFDAPSVEASQESNQNAASAFDQGEIEPATVFEAPSDVGLEFESASDFSAPTSVEVERDVVAPDDLSVSDLSDFELPEDLEATTIEAAAGDEIPVLDLSGIDLDLDVAGLPEAEEMLATPADVQVEDLVATAPLEIATDFDPFAELAETPDLAASEIVAEPVAEAESGLAAAAEIESDFDPELREEVNTKLDLARAYMEMGDREGAREILQEVLGEGDTQQKAEAEKLMAEAG
jgi:pilus assembly protein FimV